ncbi:MAG: tripartite tricarboxylate transporter substrate binding protein [Betaproteobacteria bacterium]|nr:tripartite tricarboxylate transporter substrate binding protein [Betaproteobacteria bacterium]
MLYPRFIRFIVAASGATLLGVASLSTAWAQVYPTKPIRIIVPAAAGGITDILGRAVGQKLSEQVGQPVVIDNKPGANGIIGMEAAAKSAPDGYTLVVGYTATLAINPSLYSKLPYDPVKDFAPITPALSLSLVVIAHPSVPAKNLKELIALGKAKPGQLSYGTAGIGATGHLAMELFKTLTGADFTHVPYKGNAPAYTDLLGGQVQLMFADVPGSLGYIKANRVQAFAITSPRRSPMIPDVPTVTEAGLAGFEPNILFGFLAPAGIPRDIVTRLNTEIVKVLKDPAFGQRFAAQAAEVVHSSPEEYAEYIKADIPKWAKVVKASGAKAD